MNPPTSLCHSGAGNSPGCAESPAGAFTTRRCSLARSKASVSKTENAGSNPATFANTHSAHLPALDSDGAAVLPAPRRAISFLRWQS